MRLFLTLSIVLPTVLPAQTAICTQPVYLRQSTCPTGATSCTSKGSNLTWTELDADLINIANMCNYISTGIAGGGGSGTVTSVTTGTGLTGGPITTTGTVALDFSSTLASNTLTANQCVFGANGILCEGSSADAFETYLTLTNPTADRTITLPNVSGTLITTGDTGTVTNTMLAAGVPSLSQLSNLCSGAGNQVLQWSNAGTASCIATPAGGGGGSGTVTSVGLTAPSWLSVASSPVTTSGTLAVTAATGQTSHQVIGTCGTATSFAPCALVAADIPTLNQNTTGTAAGLSTPLVVASGGTGLTNGADDNVMVGSPGSVWQSKALPACTDTAGNHLNYDTSTNTFSCGTSSSGGAGSQNVFTTISTPSGTSPVADNTTDTLTLTAGDGLTITGDSTADSVTIARDDPTNIVNIADDMLSGNAENGEYGTYGWTSNGGTAATYLASESGHPGIVRQSTPATGGAVRSLSVGATATSGVIVATDVDRWVGIVRPQQATSLEIRVGLMQDAVGTDGGTDGVWVEFNAANDSHWVCATKAASTKSTTASTVTVTAATWYKLEMRRLSGGNWECYINGSLVTTMTTNIPTAVLNFAAAIEPNSATALDLDIDFMRLKSKALGR